MTIRGNVPRLMPRFQRGEPSSARKMEQLSDAVDRLTLGTDNIQPDALPYNWLQLVQGIITGNTDDDVLVVREYRVFDAAPPFIGGTPIIVAKPYFLRRTPFDGQTRDGITYTYIDPQTRNANDGSQVLTEYVTPAYRLDDLIYFVRNVYNGTGVLFDNGQGGVFSVRSIEFAQVRAWAADPPPTP